MIKNLFAAWGAFSLVAFIILASPALGGTALVPKTGPGTVHDNGWPPARFAGDVGTTIAFVSPALIDALCGKAPEGLKTLACTDDAGLVIIPNPCGYPPTDEYARLLCHEKAHVSGWAGDHPR